MIISIITSLGPVLLRLHPRPDVALPRHQARPVRRPRQEAPGGLRRRPGRRRGRRVRVPPGAPVPRRRQPPLHLLRLEEDRQRDEVVKVGTTRERYVRISTLETVYRVTDYRVNPKIG